MVEGDGLFHPPGRYALHNVQNVYDVLSNSPYYFFRWFSSTPIGSRYNHKFIPIRGSTLIWWRGVDSNHRRRSRQIYNLIPLATREPLQKLSGLFCWRIKALSMRQTPKTAPYLAFQHADMATGNSVWGQNKGLSSGQPPNIWCRHHESNAGPTDYKSVALPTELCRQNYAVPQTAWHRAEGILM